MTSVDRSLLATFIHPGPHDPLLDSFHNSEVPGHILLPNILNLGALTDKDLFIDDLSDCLCYHVLPKSTKRLHNIKIDFVGVRCLTRPFYLDMPSRQQVDLGLGVGCLAVLPHLYQLLLIVPVVVMGYSEVLDGCPYHRAHQRRRVALVVGYLLYFLQKSPHLPISFLYLLLSLFLVMLPISLHLDLHVFVSI